MVQSNLICKLHATQFLGWGNSESAEAWLPQPENDQHKPKTVDSLRI